MRSLIIGVSSLHGKYMYDYMKSEGYECLGTKLPDEMFSLPDGSVMDLDLSNDDAICSVLKAFKPDYIFNFASQNSVKSSWEDPEKTVNVNIKGTINLLEQIRLADNKPVVIVLGAGEEYGRVSYHKFPILECEPLHPNNVYAASKACQTMMAQIYHKAYGLKVIIARVFNIIGPGQSERYAISNFCKQCAIAELKNDDFILKTGNLNIERDFIDVRDFVRACLLLAQKGKYGDIYNVSSGRAVCIFDVVRILEDLVNVKIKVQVQTERMRLTDIPKLEANVYKIAQDTGWKSNIPLEKSVSDMLDGWRQIIRGISCE